MRWEYARYCAPLIGARGIEDLGASLGSMIEQLAANHPTAYWAVFAALGLFTSTGAVTILRWLVGWELRIRADARWRRDGRRISRTVRNTRVSAPHPLIKPAQIPTRTINGLADYLDGPRARPFGSDPGPRDW